MASPGGLARIFSDLIPSEKVLVAFTSAAMPWLTRVGILTSEAEAEEEKREQAWLFRINREEKEKERREAKGKDPVDPLETEQPPPEETETVPEAFKELWQKLLARHNIAMNASITAPFSLLSHAGMENVFSYKTQLLNVLKSNNGDPTKAWEYVNNRLGDIKDSPEQVWALYAAASSVPGMVNYAITNTPHLEAAPDTRLA